MSALNHRAVVLAYQWRTTYSRWLKEAHRDPDHPLKRRADALWEQTQTWKATDRATMDAAWDAAWRLTGHPPRKGCACVGCTSDLD